MSTPLRLVRRGTLPGDGARPWLDHGALPDALDLALIRMLQRDGRATVVELSEATGATEKAVRGRIAALREERRIEITTVADPALLGYRSMAMACIEALPGSDRLALARGLFAVDAVDYVVVTSGRFDVMAEILCTDDDALRTTVDTAIRTCPGAARVELLPYLELRYQQPVWDLAQAREAPPPRGDGHVPDGVDLAIVRELNGDGRAAFSRIAEVIGVSESQVRKRYARLTGSGLIRVMAITNPRSLGYEVTAWLAIGVAPGVAIGSVADRLSALPSVAYLSIVAGRHDLLAEVVCRDKAGLLALIDGEIRPWPEIERLETALCQHLCYRRVAALP